ncbi:hypothetical protein [Psychroserpens sp.]|uniref:hypothetical protein n=1 Tax=Psychroserpens sp. TaxID=2020870 RepID=UPI0038588322
MGVIVAFGVIMCFKTTFAIQEETGFMTCIPDKTPQNLCEDLTWYKNLVFATAPTFTVMRWFRKPILKFLSQT